MRVLMLGWEYPPHISGGLGTACAGLTRGLARQGVEILFVVPKIYGGEDADHMLLFDSYQGLLSGDRARLIGSLTEDEEGVPCEVDSLIDLHRVPAALKPYWTPEDFKKYIASLPRANPNLPLNEKKRKEADSQTKGIKPASGRYGKDVFEEVENYTDNLVRTLANESYDLIHAHDWMTYPAAVALARISGKPMLAHVHSLEYDRSGRGVNPRINAIEGMGVHEADAVIAVSYYTRSIIHQVHGVPLEKIHVVHNGIYPKPVDTGFRKEWEIPRKIVLFLGRVTFQKGPEFFLEVVPRVVPHVRDVLFVMAGSGDMLPKMMRTVNEMGIADYVHFAGFLKGREVDRMFSVSDLYVMPSVSEPFGISALEAVNFDTPAIISKQSGVSEVLSAALKFDFWDVDRLSDLIINGLLYKDLRADLVRFGKRELRKLKWDASAKTLIEVYNNFSGVKG